MTNQLFREVLDGRIPLARKRIRPGFYFLPVGSFDPAAPTLKDLASAINLSQVVTIELPPQAGLTTVANIEHRTMAIEAAAREEEREARNRAMTEAAAAMGREVADMEAALIAMGAAARNSIPAITKPTPTPPWAGNIATQKRRRKL